MVAVGPDAAFGVHKAGQAGRSFPLSFSVREQAGAWLVTGTAARAADIADVLARGMANDTVLIHSMETTAFYDEDNTPWPLSRVLAEYGVAGTVHPMPAWAAGGVGLGTDLLVLHRDDLGRLLADDWSPYGLGFIDLPGPPSPARLDELALAIGTTSYPEPLVPALDGTSLRFSGHDDCYLLVESTVPGFPGAVLGRLLALLVGSALLGLRAADRVEAPAPIEVPEPAPELPAQLIADSPYWIGVLGPRTETTVAVHLTAVSESWRLSEELPTEPAHIATLHVPTGTWRLAPA
ncbi:hypothetical protein [Yinghuangia soli]|uniref:Uncharacterized protein n=1 Tax=Yinghuangia soli TaxID=2908204 RepID=A0AA41U2I4_9ACTN|nr:hypothetical protein [Yinghuangia soli]MCF2530715.1 hypothetical protein [Yinghuangia soli]